MTPDLRAALRLLAEAYPAGTLVPVLREHLLALVDGETAPVVQGDLTCKAVGSLIGRHASTVRAMCERGELSGAYRQHGREWRIPPGAVETYREAQRHPAAQRKDREAIDLGAWRSVKTA